MSKNFENSSAAASVESLLGHRADSSYNERYCDGNEFNGPVVRKCGYFRRVVSWRPVIIVKNIVLIFLAIWGVASLLYQLRQLRAHRSGPKSTTNVQTCYCGESISEAQSMGCVYDELSAAWLQEECRDDELTAEFSRAGPGINGSWTYWADKDHTQELSIYEVSLYVDKQPELFLAA